MIRFEFVGQVDDCDGCVIRREPQGRLPWKMDLFSTRGEGRETRLDQQMSLSFDPSFVAERDSDMMALIGSAKTGKRLKVIIETVED